MNCDPKTLFGEALRLALECLQEIRMILTHNLVAALTAALCVLQSWDLQAAAALAPTNHLARLSVTVLPLN
jgi:hypothetical protein